MKAQFFDSATTVKTAEAWYEKHKGLIRVVRKEVGKYGMTVWYTPKFKEAV